MSRHGITSLQQARKAERAIERCLAAMDKAVFNLRSDAHMIDSSTLERLARDLEDEVEKAVSDSCLEIFRDDCKQAAEEWDGEEDFGMRFDIVCRLPS